MSVQNTSVALLGDGDVLGIRVVDHDRTHPAIMSLDVVNSRIILAFSSPESIDRFVDSLLDLRDECWPDDDDSNILHFAQPFIPFAEPVPA